MDSLGELLILSSRKLPSRRISG